MKILFDHCHNYPEDSDDFKLGFGAFRHSKDHPWFGFTVNLYLFNHKFIVTYVSDNEKYQEVMNRRHPKYRVKPGENN